MRLFRRLIAILVVGAFFGATMLQAAPIAMATGTDISAIGHEQGDKPMPCHDPVPDCMFNVGCIFMVSLPAPNVAISTYLSWSTVVYAIQTGDFGGVTIKPALGPPIQHA